MSVPPRPVASSAAPPATSIAQVLDALARETLVAFGEADGGAFPEPVAPEMALRPGTWNGRAVSLATTIHRSAHRELRMASIVGAGDSICSLTVLVLPRGVDGAVFAADLVGFGGVARVAILDVLLPSAEDDTTPRSTRVERLALGPRLGDARTALGDCADAASPEAISQAPFSARVAFLHPRAGREDDFAERLPATFRAYRDAVLFGNLDDLRRSNGGTDRFSHGPFLGALGRVKKQSKIVAKLFGEAWCDDYFQHVFLAEPKGARPFGTASELADSGVARDGGPSTPVSDAEVRRGA